MSGIKIECQTTKKPGGLLQIEHTLFGTCIGTSRVRLLARRVIHPEYGDEAQLEIRVSELGPNAKREVSAASSVILTPAQARELALAICPELSKDKQ